MKVKKSKTWVLRFPTFGRLDVVSGIKKVRKVHNIDCIKTLRNIFVELSINSSWNSIPYPS